MEAHPFTTLKTPDKEPVKTVELRGVNFKVYKDGRVFHRIMSREDEIYRMSPLAAEVRKASGWFE